MVLVCRSSSPQLAGTLFVSHQIHLSLLLSVYSQGRKLKSSSATAMANRLLQPHNFSIVICFLLSCAVHFAESQSYVGVNYGQVADNLPPAEQTVKLLQSSSISKVRLYGADPILIKALANTGIGIVIGVANGDIPALATDPNQATQWINSNVLPYYPSSKIILITVGNEVLLTDDQNLMSQLLPAMQNIANAINTKGLQIKVSTVHSMAVLSASDPPSSGAFNSTYGDIMKALLDFQRSNGSPFTINPYPYFAYQSDPRDETLKFCLFQPNDGRVDGVNGIKYMNMFDAQVDAVHSALNAMGFKDIEIMVAETGWPYRGDPNEVGPSIDNAKAYNGGLLSHLRSMVGTPLIPGKSIDTYIFALYDEDLKPGPTSERSFGLYNPDLSMTYDIGLSKSSSSQEQTTPSTSPSSPAPQGSSSTSTPPTTKAPQGSSSSTPPTTKPPSTQGGWCVPKTEATDDQLQANLDWACGQGGVDCGPISQGGACFEPNTVASHAAYAMNVYYQSHGRLPDSCDFSQTATVTSVNPSHDSCVYPGAGNAHVLSQRLAVANNVGLLNIGFWWWGSCCIMLFLLFL